MEIIALTILKKLRQMRLEVLCDEACGIGSGPNVFSRLRPLLSVLETSDCIFTKSPRMRQMSEENVAKLLPWDLEVVRTSVVITLTDLTITKALH